MAKKPMKLKTLEQYLQQVEGFDRPKVQLEQYATSPHLAACVLLAVQDYGDLTGRLVADLGCGCGSLTFGAAKLGAALTVGFDIDQDALDIFAMNREELEEDACDTVQCDVTSSLSERWHDAFDTVIMNPPFGTRVRGVDLQFVRTALHLATTAVYSLHKSSTRKHVLTAVREWGVCAEVIAQLRFDLPNTYRHHTKSSVDIEVDLVRFWFDKPKTECTITSL